MPATYPVALSGPRPRRPRPGTPSGPDAAPTGPTAAPTGPVGGPRGPMAALRFIPAPMRPFIPIALLLLAGYAAFRLGRGRKG